MELRRSRPDDALAVAELESSPPDPDVVEMWRWRLAGADEHLPVVLAEEGGDVVGLVWVDIPPDASGEATDGGDGAGVGRLRALYVDPAHRGRGYGRRLLVCGQRLLAAESAGRITMEASDDPGLTTLVARLGWRQSADGWEGDLDESAYVDANRWSWNDWADWYVDAGRSGYSDERRASPSWGCFGVPEVEVGLLSDLAGSDVVELGCGTGYVSVWCLDAGARSVVALDNSPGQLATARMLQADSGVTFPLVWADAEHVPLADASFDVAISEYGAAIWCDPYRWIPEAARLLRPGGRLIFLGTSVALTLCVEDFETDGTAGPTMRRPQRGMRRFTWPDSTGVEFHLSHGDMIRTLRSSGFLIEDLIELYVPPDATSRYSFVDAEWGSRWPIEEVWVARLADDSSV